MDQPQMGVNIPVFIYGTLRDAELLTIVLDRVVAPIPATLPGHAVYHVNGASHPMLSENKHESVTGVLLFDLSDIEVARLDYYERPYGYKLQTHAVQSDGRRVTAAMYRATEVPEKGALWNLTDWQRNHGDLSRIVAQEIMTSFGHEEASTVDARMSQIKARAHAKMLAQSTDSNRNLSSALTADDVRIESQTHAHKGFFLTDNLTLRHRKFGGDWTCNIDRAVFVMVDAVTVLPYDPTHDTVLLVEQFRPGPLRRGDAHPWLLEAIAGRIDAGETPSDTARREALEEAGLSIGELHSVSGYYPSPGAVTEYIHSFVAVSDLSDILERFCGLEEESEDIRALVLPFEDLMQAIDTGEIRNGPLVLSGLWLWRHRAGLRQPP